MYKRSCDRVILSVLRALVCSFCFDLTLYSLLCRIIDVAHLPYLTSVYIVDINNNDNNNDHFLTSKTNRMKSEKQHPSSHHTPIHHNGLNSNNDLLPPPRQPETRLRQTRRRHLRLPRRLPTRLALSRRNKTLLATLRSPLTTILPPNHKPTNLSTSSNLNPKVLKDIPRLDPPHHPRPHYRSDNSLDDFRRNVPLSPLVSPQSPSPINQNHHTNPLPL